MSAAASLEEAMRRLSAATERADVAQAYADRLYFERNQLLAVLDGQEGISRTAMGEACGLSRGRAHQILRARRYAPRGAQR